MDTLAYPQDETRPFSLPAWHAGVSHRAAELGARYAARHREVRAHPFEHRELHPGLWGEICEQGWPGLLVPTEHGGSEGGLLAYLVVMEALAESNLILWMAVLSAAIGHALAVVGPDAARRRWLPGVASGQTLLALAVTEPGCGHNVFRTESTVRRDGSRFLIDGVKAVTSGIDLAERVLVFGRAPDGEADGRRFTTVFVDPCAPGIERTELEMGRREGARQFQLSFDGVETPAEELVGAEGEGLMTLWPFTHIERLMTAALCLGNARYCIDRAIARAGERSIFGRQPIGAEQAIQHPLAHLHSRHAAARLLVHSAGAGFDADADMGRVAAEANMTKVLTADLLFDAADQAMQTLGAAAWDEREGMIDLFLDARAARSAPISQELALNFIAQHALGLPARR